MAHCQTRNADRITRIVSPVATLEEADMPILIPVLWVGGAAILLGGGWYVIGHMVQ
jgi:hypothetical protein